MSHLFKINFKLCQLACLLSLLVVCVVCTRPKAKKNNTDWLSSYSEDDEMWSLRTKRFNITCYSGRVLFPYGPECADFELSKDKTRSDQINLHFNMSFMGHKFDKAWVNQHGIISFQESFLGQTLSQEDWPHPKYPYVDDPVFIAPLYAQTDLAGDKIEDLTSVKYGRVLYKELSRIDLPQIHTEEQKFVYMMSMKILDDGQKQIRESISGAEEFIATNAFIATWKSVAFLGNSLTDIDQRPRNTFQVAILTNTNYTFAIFNYEHVDWYAATSQGGNPETGTGGKAAKVGFNRGNGTLWYGHKPFSENAQLMQSIANYSNVDQPGRFIFRIDEWIQPAGCMTIDFDQETTLKIWPRSGNMLGGQEVNVTGPCFHNNTFFLCKWGDGYNAPVTIGETTYVNKIHSEIRGRCIQPLLFYNGRLNLSISLDNGTTYDWKTEYTIVDPLRYPAKVEMVNINEWHAQSSPPRLIIKWNRFDMSYAESDMVDIELWGYYEDDYGPHWDYIQLIGKDKLNKGSFGFDVAPNRAPNQTMARKYKVGAMAVSLFDSQFADHSPTFTMSKRIFGALHPIGWWRNDEMKFFYDKKSYLFGNSRGKNWAEDQCRWWHQYRRYDRYWMDDLELCPPTVMFAIGDIGVWAPDPSCNMYGGQYNELNCLQHMGAAHCVITMKRTSTGAGNRCCYDNTGNLMYTNDTSSGSTPDRYHSLGMPPYNVYGKVPGLSHYFHDIVPYYLCCHWSKQCGAYLYLRETKDARGYKEPRMAVAYGDPHLITFDGKDYTFNGKGEFTLFKSKRHNFRLQARFEQLPNATYCLLSTKGQVNATRITAIAVGQDDSDTVEVRARVYPSQTANMRCDVLVNGKTYYFNFTEEKVQLFKNVYVLSPLHDTHQSNITIMFNSSGVGVNVECAFGIINVRTSAPFSMFKETAGLFGYWDNITANDFTSPDGSSNQLTLKPDLLYQRFGMAWRLKDESESIFSYTGSWKFDTFHDQLPMIREWQRFRPWFTHTEIAFPSNVSFTKEQMWEACQGDEQCLFDAAAMGSLEVGERTRDSHRFFRNLHENMKSVNSCGIYLMQGGQRHLSKGNYLSGTVMKVTCDKGYTLFGWDEFYCNWNATWLPTNGQWIEQFRDWPYCEHFHITAIRWTSVGLSIIWLICLAAAVIYYFFFKKQKEYEMKDTETYNHIPFKDPQDHNEIASFQVFDTKSYNKDGFLPNPRNLSKSSEILNSQYSPDNSRIEETNTSRLNELPTNVVPVEQLKKPYMLIQIPKESPPSSNVIPNQKIPQNSQINRQNITYVNQQENSQRPIISTPLNFNNYNDSSLSESNQESNSGIREHHDLNSQEQQLLQQKQLDNPYLQKMQRAKEQQRRQIQMQLQNQQNQNMINVPSTTDV